MKFEEKYEDGSSNIIYCKNNYYEEFDNNKFYNNNGMQYYRGYLLHRQDGPAIEWSDRSISWILNGKKYLEKEYWNMINLKKKSKVLDEV